MTRLTVDRSAIRAEVERRKAVQSSAGPAPEAPKSPGTHSPKRWSAKVFVVPASVAQAIAKLASRSVFGPMNGPHVGERHSMRRHRGVYIWRPASDQLGGADDSDALLAMPDEHTAETEIAKLRKELH